MFSSADSLGARSNSEIATYLQSIGDSDGAKDFLNGDVAGQGMFGPPRAYKATGMVLGFIEPPANDEKTLPIVGVSQIVGDKGLVDKRIKITMDRFYVHEYPGSGQHDILCEFSGKNQVAGETEELRLALRFKARDGAAASLSGSPIFLGVTVGRDGIAFDGRSVNLGSKNDEQVLSTFESPAFQSGLSLLTSAQPALKPLVGLAASVVKSVATKSQNCQVHDFKLGLDFESGGTSARLRIGSYIVVQTDEDAWDWDHYAWNRDAMSLHDKATNANLKGSNYMVFSVARFSDV